MKRFLLAGALLLLLVVGCQPPVDIPPSEPIPTSLQGLQVQDFQRPLDQSSWNYDLNEFLKRTDIEIIAVREMTSRNGWKYYQVWYKPIKKIDVEK